MNRRSFMKSILAAGVAPYVVTAAGVLMPVRAIAAPKILVWGDSMVGYDDIMTATEVLERQKAWLRESVNRLRDKEQFWIDPVYRRLLAAGAFTPWP